MARRIPVPEMNLEVLSGLLREPEQLEAMRKHLAQLRIYPNWEYVKYHTPPKWKPEVLWQAFLFKTSRK